VVEASEIVSDLFTDHLTALVIQHALMASFLNTMSRVLVHLLTLHYSVVTAHGTMSLRLVNFILWSSIWAHSNFLMISLLDELAFSELPGSAHVGHHPLGHIAHHFLSPSKDVSTSSSKSSIFEEGIVSEWIFSEHASTSEARHHVVHSLYHLLVHVIKVRDHVLP